MYARRPPVSPHAPAAAPFAAWLAGRVPGRHPCLVLCGANDAWRVEDVAPAGLQAYAGYVLAHDLDLGAE